MNIAQFYMHTSSSQLLLTVNDSSLVPYFIHSFFHVIILLYFFSYNDIQINSHIIIQEREFSPAAPRSSLSPSYITENPAISNLYQKKTILLTLITILSSSLTSRT